MSEIQRCKDQLDLMRLIESYGDSSNPKVICCMDEPTPKTNIRPPDRRWMIFGILLGAGLGYLPVYFPAPLDHLALCCFGGALCGLIFPAVSFFHCFVQMKDTRLLIALSLGGAALGTIIGLIRAFDEKPLPDGFFTASMSFGTAAGAVISEVLLKRAEARYKQLLEAEEELDA